MTATATLKCPVTTLKMINYMALIHTNSSRSFSLTLMTAVNQDAYARTHMHVHTWKVQRKASHHLCVHLLAYAFRSFK